MKRLIRDRDLITTADAARLQDTKLDPNAAFSAIQSVDEFFKPERQIADSAAGTKAYWGAISDDAKYVCEAYIYDGNKDIRKAAFVAAPVDALGNLEVSIRSVERASEIRGLVKSGITFPSGMKLVFSNEYTSLQEAQDAQPKEEVPADENQQVAASKK